MIILITVMGIVFVVSLLGWLDRQTSPTDSREPYLRDSAGRIWALKVGPGVSHEDYIHDGTPHQNPAIKDESRWWLIFHYTVEVSYYPITINGRLLPDIDAIQQQVDEAQRRGVDVELVTLNPQLEREVIVRENGTQLGRDVSTSDLAYRRNGRRR